MKKVIGQDGIRYVLPIVGDIVSEVVLSVSNLPKIVFKDHENGESEMEFEEAITLNRGDIELYLTGAIPGKSFDPTQLHPLVSLLGSVVSGAFVYRDGRLELVFSNKWTLQVIPEGSGSMLIVSPLLFSCCSNG